MDAAPVKADMFGLVGVATDMLPLTGMEVNWAPTPPEALATAGRVTLLALEALHEVHELTRTVELAACQQTGNVAAISTDPFSGTYAELGMAMAAAEPGVTGAAEPLVLTGQTVVDTATTLVTTTVELAGHAVTFGAQLVMVICWVAKMVEVVISTEELDESIPVCGEAVAAATRPANRAVVEHFILRRGELP